MKNKPYSVVGNRENGYRIAVPTETGAQAGDKYECTIFEEACLDLGEMEIPKGALLYVPRKGKPVVPE
jgi:hypothetical protein